MSGGWLLRNCFSSKTKQNIAKKLPNEANKKYCACARGIFIHYVFSLHWPHPLLMPAFLAKNATYNVHDVQLAVHVDLRFDEEK